MARGRIGGGEEGERGEVEVGSESESHVHASISSSETAVAFLTSHGSPLISHLAGENSTQLVRALIES